jgi:hypothetical protein
MATATLSFEPPVLSVVPDRQTVGELRVRNEGSDEERFTFDVVGDSRTWVSVAPFALTIGPGEEGTARIFLRPPRLPSVRAGRHSVVIQVRIGDDRKQEMTATAEVDVSAYREISIALDPAQPSTGHLASSRLTIDNRGNDMLRATVSGADPTGAIAVTADPAVVEVDAGETTVVRVDTRAPRPLLGAARDHRFTVVVQPDGGTPSTASGSLHQAPMISRRLLVGVAAVVAVALVAVLLRSVVFSSSSSTGSSAAATTTSAKCPGAGHLAHDANGQVRQKILEPDNYSFLFLQPNNCFPVRWNPCAAIHYVINGAAATPDEIATTQQAATDAGQATGIDFVYDGLTTETPAGRRPAYQPTVYGDRWAPVLIQWTHLGGANSLTEAAGGGVPTQVGGINVSGVVFLNVDAHLADNSPLPSGFGAGVTWGRIVLHELGHVLGLGHVNGVEEIMHDPVTEQTSPTSAYGLGDLAGLRLLGKSAGCLTTPTPAPGA